MTDYDQGWDDGFESRPVRGETELYMEGWFDGQDYRLWMLRRED